MTAAADALKKLLPFGLVPELLDVVPYPCFVYTSDLAIRCANSAARRQFALTDDEIARLNRERLGPGAMRDLREARLRPWLSGAANPRPVPYRWEGSSGAGDFMALPFPMPGETGVFALVLIPSAMLEEMQVEASRRAAARARKWFVPGAAQAEARDDAEAIRGLDALRRGEGKPSALTTREWEIARRIASGDRVSLLAEDLRISPNTVRNHLKAIFRKLGVNSQPQLVRTVRALQATAATGG
jgi:DNA-binding CsgD family transcriptional regulator